MLTCYFFSTSANGNCLFNACSIALTGNESLSSYLRCLTSVELFENAKFYANHPLIESQHKNGAFTSLKNAFAMCLSDAALTIFEQSDEIAAVLEEAKQTANNYTFSSMVCMVALSTVIQCGIQSYFPISNDTVAKENWDSLAKMFNCTIYPRDHIHGNAIEYVHFFRCAAMPQRYLVDRRIPSTKNHFVTFCQPVKALQPAEHYFKPHLPTLLLSAKPVHCKVPQAPPSAQVTTVKLPVSTKEQSVKPVHCDVPHVAPPSTRVTSVKSTKKQTTGTKRKQVSLDVLLPKKRACETQSSIASQSDRPSTSQTFSSVTPTTKKSDTKTQQIPKEKPASTNSWPDDIYNYVNLGSSLPESKKYNILCSHWKPGSDYSFPPDENTGRRFQYAWLTRFPWLAYSAVANGGFCINCVLFGGESTHNASKLQRLMTSALPPSASAVQKLCQHGEKSNVHAMATLRATQFKLMVEKKTIGIDVQVNTARQELIEKNRSRLRPIVDCIITCVRQNLALRGHRDDAQHYLDEEDPNNPGNFIEILKYGARCGNLMDLLFSDCASNQTYRSKTIQNEIIEICGELITEEIVNEIKDAKFFTVYCSNVEQMAIVLRFIDNFFKVREEFLRFVPCMEGLSGEALSTEIKNFIQSVGLRMEECRGQGYDGAGNMAGKLSGVAARILQNYEKAVYVHCGSHILNLCVASACQIEVIRNMMDNVRSVSDFFNNSPKRTLVLKEKIKKSILNPIIKSSSMFVAQDGWQELKSSQSFARFTWLF